MQVGQAPDPRNRGNESDTSWMNRAMKQAVLSGLAHFATKQSLEVLVAILEQEHAVDFQKLAEDTGALRVALEELFGSGASVVEARISQGLAREIGIEYDGSSLDQMVMLLRRASIVEASNPTH